MWLDSERQGAGEGDKNVGFADECLAFVEEQEDSAFFKVSVENDKQGDTGVGGDQCYIKGVSIEAGSNIGN